MPGKIYIDLTELIIYAANFDQISGVQRVEIELVKLIVNRYPSIEIINVFEVNAARLKKVLYSYRDEEDLFRRLNREFAHWGLGPNHSRHAGLPSRLKCIFKGSLRRHRFRHLEVQKGDIVFIPAGFGFAEAFSSFYRMILAQGARLVFLIHDVIPVTQPAYTPEGVERFFMLAFRLPADIITTTRFNRDDFKIAFEKVTGTPYRLPLHVVPLAHEFPGVCRDEGPLATLSPKVKEALGDRDFILCVGTIEIRKNHMVLLNVWRALREELGDSLPLLVIAGRRGWKAEATLALLDEVVAQQEPIRFIEEPSDQDLKYLYSSCLFSIMPSLFEGWGLPVGESLWFGKVCAASNTSSIPEVGGDLCLYFDPHDPDGVSSAIKQLLDRKTREAYERKIHNARLRTWAEVARDLIEVLLKISTTSAEPLLEWDEEKSERFSGADKVKQSA
jgi:glycosyltransferase involved in cell wall biosynthesis